MSSKIIIDFDDEKESNKKSEDRIVISFDDEAGSGNEKKETQEERDADEILKSKISCNYYGNFALDNFRQSDIKFPEGIEQGFRRKFSVNTEDDFLNSILESNKYIILSSKRGSIYLIDRFTGRITEKVYFEFQSFEKTGVVYNNAAYLASVKKIFLMTEGKFSEIYQAEEPNFIWSNLNRYSDTIVFTELNPESGKVCLKSIDHKNNNCISLCEFQTESFLSDKICIANNEAYVLFDSKLLIYDFKNKSGQMINLNFKTDENSFLFYLNKQLYVTTTSNELYYLDLPSVSLKFKFSGIKNNYINSIAAFDDNIFTGTPEGWKFFKTSGMTVYNFENEHENKIECVSRNVLALSQRNKIIFINLNRFQEAEGFVIASKERNEQVEIISALISKREIFVLTKSGILEVFINDKMNIHV